MLVMTRRMSQLTGFLILVSMVFVLLSVGSYSLDDPTWNYHTSQEVIAVENLGGRVGAFLADWGLQLFGSTVFVFIACTALGATCLMRARMRPILGAAWRGLLLIVAASTLAHLYWVDDPFFQAGLLAGGASGQWLAEFLVPYLELPGTYAVAGLSVLCVLLSCVRLSLFKGFRRVVADVRLTKEHREADDSFLFNEDLDLRSHPSAFPDEDDKGGFADETASEESKRATIHRAKRFGAETSVADPNLEPATPAESRPSKVFKPPSFLAQRAKGSQQSLQVQASSGETISEKSNPEETPRVEHSASKISTLEPGRKSVASSEHPPSKIPVLPSFRAKYVMELQRSIQKPSRETVSEKSDEEEVSLIEPPMTEDNGIDPNAGELAPSEGRASQTAKRPSFRAKRATEPPRIVEALQQETVSEEIDRLEVSAAERSMPEVSVAEPTEEQTASLEAPVPQVSILQPLPVKHVTPPQQPQLPSLDLLEAPLETEAGQSEEELMEQARFLEQKLREFGVEGEVVQVSPGPVITMYEFAPLPASRSIKLPIYRTTWLS